MIILVDPLYNPNFKTAITSGTKLTSSITVSKFLGAVGTPTTIEEQTAQGTDLNQLARNLYLHAEAIKMVNETSAFNNITLIPSEVIYPEGKIVYYHVVDKQGKVSLSASFDVAEFWKDFINFNKITLSYDEYNSDGSLFVSIGLEMPSVPTSFDVTFSKSIATEFNGNIKSSTQLIEYVP
jgi:hypothetical protein